MMVNTYINNHLHTSCLSKSARIGHALEVLGIPWKSKTLHKMVDLVLQVQHP